ncbi:hypothetical protein ENBRE01_0444 [Enteropsectra breve]|nr:hypothetical protein ENBRE01_0444 [Enteropsectra breve]
MDPKLEQIRSLIDEIKEYRGKQDELERKASKLEVKLYEEQTRSRSYESENECLRQVNSSLKKQIKIIEQQHKAKIKHLENMHRKRLSENKEPLSSIKDNSFSKARHSIKVLLDAFAKALGLDIETTEILCRISKGKDDPILAILAEKITQLSESDKKGMA